MDPNYRSKPTASGQFQLDKATSFYYELRGLGHEYVVFIPGSFRTLRHYDEMADWIVQSDARFQVLTFDNRGMGKSKSPLAEQTTDSLADDTLKLIDYVFGKTSKVHVFGTTIGGCIAQRLTMRLVPEGRLKSLYITASTPGVQFPLPLGVIFFRWSMGSLVKSDRSLMVKDLLRKNFSQEYLDAQSDEEGVTNGERWEKRWMEEFDEWFCFSNKNACAVQSAAYAKHQFNVVDAAAAANGQFPRVVEVHALNKLVKPAKQMQLATLLHAQVVKLDIENLGTPADLSRFLNALLAHMQSAATTEIRKLSNTSEPTTPNSLRIEIPHRDASLTSIGEPPSASSRTTSPPAYRSMTGLSRNSTTSSIMTYSRQPSLHAA